MPYTSQQRDLEWASAIRNGDEKAFEKLFRTYTKKLCNFADQYVDSSEVAEEIVQDVFLEIWDNRRGWEPNKNVRAYLYKSVRNSALDYLKHEDVVETWKKEAGVKAHNLTKSPGDHLRQKELGRSIQDAMAELSERQRVVFILARRHEMTYKEVAETLDISVKTVETHISEALKRLRAALNKFN